MRSDEIRFNSADASIVSGSSTLETIDDDAICQVLYEAIRTQVDESVITFYLK